MGVSKGMLPVEYFCFSKPFFCLNFLVLGLSQCSVESGHSILGILKRWSVWHFFLGIIMYQLQSQLCISLCLCDTYF